MSDTEHTNQPSLVDTLAPMRLPFMAIIWHMDGRYFRERETRSRELERLWYASEAEAIRDVESRYREHYLILDVDQPNGKCETKREMMQQEQAA